MKNYRCLEGVDMENKLPEVSVIITTYKGSHVILQCVNSVLGQTFKNLECIVVDDNGKGTEEQIKTENILCDLIAQNKIVYFAEDTNQNASAARNIGARLAQGKYLSFLDDDDVFFDKKIEKQICALESNEDVEICYCQLKDIVEGKGVVYHKAPTYANFTFEFLMMKVPVCTSTLFITKRIFEAVNGFNESFIRHQDWEFIARLSLKSGIVGVDYIGTEKHTRNIFKRFTAKQSEEFRLYFLSNIENVIGSLTKKQKSKFYTLTYQELAKLYIRECNFKRAFYFLAKSHHPISFFFIVFAKNIVKLFRTC